MYELRVLSGLHQGAALPLIGEQWTVGASEDDDLALFEPDLAAGALSLARLDGQWTVNGEPVEAQNPWQLGHVWLMISHTTSPWESFEQPAEKVQEQTPTGKTSKWGIGLLGTAVVTLSSWAMSVPVVEEPQPAATPIDAPLPLNNTELTRDILHHMLKDRDLGSININVGQQDITLSGTLVTEEELQRLSRMVERFNRKYQSPLPLHNEVRQRQFKLPFRITQVTTGPMAHLVTNDGNRLFVGDEVEGVRLLEIADNRIIFGGKFQLELAW